MADSRLSTTSPILAMHARYEAAQAAYTTLDNAQSATRRGAAADSSYTLAVETGMTRADAESDALRTAILYQVPNTAEEALILQYHVWIAVDLYGQDAPDLDRAAMLTAIDALFDFAVSTTPLAADAAPGRQFAYGADRVRERRSFRTGKLEG